MLLGHGGIFLLCIIRATEMGNLVNFEGRWVICFAETQNTQAKPQNAAQNADKTAAFLVFFACFAKQNWQKPARGAALELDLG